MAQGKVGRMQDRACGNATAPIDACAASCLRPLGLLVVRVANAIVPIPRSPPDARRQTTALSPNESGSHCTRSRGAAASDACVHTMHSIKESTAPASVRSTYGECARLGGNAFCEHAVRLPKSHRCMGRNHPLLLPLCMLELSRGVGRAPASSSAQASAFSRYSLKRWLIFPRQTGHELRRLLGLKSSLSAHSSHAHEWPHGPKT